MKEAAGKRYEDSTLTRSAKFFIFAPPLIGKRKSKRPLPNAPFKGAESWQTSIYYLWWEYLRRSEAYRKTCSNGGKGRLAKLYNDFGDIFEERETLKDTFWEWWKQHAHLFWEPEARQTVIASDAKDTEETDLIIRLPSEVRAAHIVRQVRRLLREHEATVKRAREKSRAKYPVCSKVKLTSLYRHLTVYDVMVANPKLKLHEIADEAGLVVDERIKIYDEDSNFDGNRSISWLLKHNYEAYVLEAERIIKRRKRQIARQHIKAAEVYIANAERGLFPYSQHRKTT